MPGAVVVAEEKDDDEDEDDDEKENNEDDDRIDDDGKDDENKEVKSVDWAIFEVLFASRVVDESAVDIGTELEKSLYVDELLKGPVYDKLL